MPMPHDHYQYGYRVDCAKEGCDPPHADDGRVIVFNLLEMQSNRGLWRDGKPTQSPKFNGHETTLVRRSIGMWERFDPSEET